MTSLSPIENKGEELDPEIWHAVKDNFDDLVWKSESPIENNQELREQIAKKLKWWRKHELTELYYPLDDIMSLIEQAVNQALKAHGVIVLSEEAKENLGEILS